MKNTSVVNRWLDKAGHVWGGLNAREQKLVSIGSVVVGLSVLWFVMIDPAWTTLRKVKDALPAAIAQAGQAQSLAQELRQMRGGAQQKKLAANASLKDVVTGSLAERQWTAKATIAELNGTGVSVKLKDVPAVDALAWIDSMDTQPGAVLGQLLVTKTSAGIVDVSVEVQRPSADGP